MSLNTLQIMRGYSKKCTSGHQLASSADHGSRANSSSSASAENLKATSLSVAFRLAGTMVHRWTFAQLRMRLSTCQGLNHVVATLTSPKTPQRGLNVVPTWSQREIVNVCTTQGAPDVGPTLSQPEQTSNSVALSALNRKNASEILPPTVYISYGACPSKLHGHRTGSWQQALMTSIIQGRLCWLHHTGREPSMLHRGLLVHEGSPQRGETTSTTPISQCSLFSS